MSQNLHVDDFKRVENTSQFNKDFVEEYNHDSNDGYFPLSWCSISQIIAWTSWWFTIFTWKNKNWKSWKRSYTHNKFKTSTKSLISIDKKCTESLTIFWLKFG